MLLWTNDPNLRRDPKAAQHSLELWLCQFRALEFSELITGACDLAMMNELFNGENGLQVPMILRLVIPREPGVYEQLLPLWNEQMQAHYPHMGVSITADGVGGSGSLLPPLIPGQAITRRYKTWGTQGATIDCSDLFSGPYERFIQSAQDLAGYGVEVEDSRKQIRLVPLLKGERYHHQPFTLQPA